MTYEQFMQGFSDAKSAMDERGRYYTCGCEDVIREELVEFGKEDVFDTYFCYGYPSDLGGKSAYEITNEYAKRIGADESVVLGMDLPKSDPTVAYLAGLSEDAAEEPVQAKPVEPPPPIQTQAEFLGEIEGLIQRMSEEMRSQIAGARRQYIDLFTNELDGLIENHLCDTTDVDVMAKYCGHEDVSLRVQLASNPNLTPAQMLGLAKDIEPSVRQSLAGNPAILGDVIEVLLSQPIEEELIMELLGNDEAMGVEIYSDIAGRIMRLHNCERARELVFEKMLGICERLYQHHEDVVDEIDRRIQKGRLQ